jgi:hypothetical protein
MNVDPSSDDDSLANLLNLRGSRRRSTNSHVARNPNALRRRNVRGEINEEVQENTARRNYTAGYYRNRGTNGTGGTGRTGNRSTDSTSGSGSGTGTGNTGTGSSTTGTGFGTAGSTGSGTTGTGTGTNNTSGSGTGTGTNYTSRSGTGTSGYTSLNNHDDNDC